ncbi:MAG: hypothetical protein ACW98U_04235 [Candidatus Thorarchaeota archaeon]
MGRFMEEISLPYGEQEAIQRIAEWTKMEGVKLKVKKKKSNFVKLGGKVGMMGMRKGVTFELTLKPDGISTECWVGGMIKDSIEPGIGWSGKLAKDSAWGQYESLKAKLLS